MILGSPGALWLLALVPLVMLLHMLRARRAAHLVSSTLLWERAARDLTARMPVRRLERSLLLVLQILAIAAVALALARPSLVMPGRAGDAVVVVVRTGASMQATDEPPTRFAAAQRGALALLAGLGPGQPAALVAAGVRPRLVLDFTADREALAAAVRALRPSDAHGATGEAVALAARLRSGGRAARVHVFGDRAPGDPRAVWHPVGRGAPNAAVAAASVRTDGRGHVLLLVRLEAFGAASTSRNVTVSQGGSLLARRAVRIDPGTPEAVVFDLGRASEMLEVKLEGEDALPADDRAFVAAGGEALPRLLVAGEPNPVLDAVLGAVPAAAVERVDRIVPGEWGRADVVVLDGVDPLDLPPGAYLLIGTTGANLPAAIDGTIRDQVVRTMSTTHPVARLADLRGVRVAAGFVLRPQGGTVVAEGDSPLVWAYEGRQVRAVVLPFSLSASDLPLHPAFPVLVANAVGWLSGGPYAPVGSQPALPAGAWARAVLTDPQGGTRVVEAQDGEFVLPPLDRVGAYHLRTAGWERRWIVRGVDPRESDLAVTPAPAGPAAAGAPAAHVPVYPWMLGLAAALVAVEWLLWARAVPRAGSVKPRP
jgi:hypothetical protein